MIVIGILSSSDRMESLRACIARMTTSDGSVMPIGVIGATSAPEIDSSEAITYLPIDGSFENSPFLVYKFLESLKPVVSSFEGIFLIRDDVIFDNFEQLCSLLQENKAFDYWGLQVKEQSSTYPIQKWMKDLYFTDKSIEVNQEACMYARNGIFLSARAVDMILEKPSSYWEPQGRFETRLGEFFNDEGLFPLLFESKHRVTHYNLNRIVRPIYEFGLDGKIKRESYEFVDG